MKQEVKKIDKALWRLLTKYIKDEPWKPEIVFALSNQIKKLFKSLGYRQIPELKILSDEQIQIAKTEAERLSWTHKPHPAFEKEKYLLHAQVDDILRQIKEYEEGQYGTI